MKKLSTKQLATLQKIEKLIPVILSYNQDIKQHIYHPDLSTDINFVEIMLNKNFDQLQLLCKSLSVSASIAAGVVTISSTDETWTIKQYFLT